MEEELPPGLDALWGKRSAERPRKQGLSRDRVVDAAIELADADGLDAVSMSRVAERLGFTTMSLYRHVRSKDELLVLMVDAAMGEPARPGAGDPLGWRPALDRWSRDLLALVRRHPWVLQVPLSRLVLGPSRIAWMETAFGALDGTGLSEAEKGMTVLLLNGLVFNEARFARELTGPGPEGEGPAMDYPAVLSAVVDADRFPAVRRALEAGIFDGDDPPDADFEFGLARVLDGIERLIDSRR
jgi:AcrR family transcriptional regulator